MALTLLAEETATRRYLVGYLNVEINVALKLPVVRTDAMAFLEHTGKPQTRNTHIS